MHGGGKILGFSTEIAVSRKQYEVCHGYYGSLLESPRDPIDLIAFNDL